jgi:hypothetical protein
MPSAHFIHDPETNRRNRTPAILPAIVMFVVAQKYLVADLTAGAAKG